MKSLSSSSCALSRTKSSEWAKLPHQHQTDGKGNDEDELGGKQPEAVRGDEPGGKTREQQVQDDQIGEEPCPEAHTGISYFSRRR